MFDELEPPFCANCGAKTKYFGKGSRVSVNKRETKSTRGTVVQDEFEEDMLGELLDELRVDTRSTGGSAATKPAMPRGTFALQGDERFSERVSETSRETKAAAKAKVVAAGAKPAVGGDTWEALQAQMKKKQAAKAAAAPKEAPVAAPKQQPKQQPQQQSRQTFAAAGDERFSERKQEQARAKPAAPNKKQQAVEMTDDDLDRQLLAELESIDEAPPKQKELPRSTFAGKAGDERFSERATVSKKKAQPQEEVQDADLDLLALEAIMDGPKQQPRVVEQFGGPAKPHTVQPKRNVVKAEVAKGGPQLPEGLQWHQTPVKSEMPRGTFAHHGDERFSDRRDPNLPTGLQSESPAQMCSFCHKPIVAGQKFKNALGGLWHNDCFKCGVCLKKLEKGMQFFKGDNGSAICGDCKTKRRVVCPLCKEPTAKTEIVNVMGAKIHVGCFKCNICDTSLLPGYVQVKGQFMCPAHKDADPVERNWGAPGDKGPGQAPKKAPVQYGPNADDKRKAAEKRAAQEQQRSGAARDSQLDLDVISSLLQEVGGEPPRESAAMRRSEVDHYFDDVDRESQSEVRQSDYRVSEVYRPSRRSTSDKSQAPPARTTIKSADDYFERQTQTKPKKQQYASRLPDDEDEQLERLSSERMMENMDKPDWMKERERQERGSFRSEARKKQAELDAKYGDGNDYYSNLSSDDEPVFEVKVTQKTTTKKR